MSCKIFFEYKATVFEENMNLWHFNIKLVTFDSSFIFVIETGFISEQITEYIHFWSLARD